MNRLFCSAFLLVGLFLLVVSCQDDSDVIEDDDATRTVIVYMVAENSLNSHAKGDINEMLGGVSSLADNNELVIYLDDRESPRIYTLTNKTTATSYSELEAEYTFSEDMNSASKDVFDEIMSYVVNNHRADSYGLVMWSHASGWIPYHSKTTTSSASNNSLLTSFGIDNNNNTSSDTGSEMDIEDIADVLSGYSNIDFVMFDACFMQCAEVVYSLRNVTDYVIGSPAEIPGTGAPYGKIMSSMFSMPVDVDGIVNNYYQYYNSSSSYGILISAVDCSKLDTLAVVTNSMIVQYKDSVESVDYSDILDYFLYDRWHSLKSGVPDYYDMKGFLMNLLSEEDYQRWYEVYQSVFVSSYATSTWYSRYSGTMRVNDEQYSGLSMFVPLEKYDGETFYEDYKKTDWGSAMEW